MDVAKRDALKTWDNYYKDNTGCTFWWNESV